MNIRQQVLNIPQPLMREAITDELLGFLNVIVEEGKGISWGPYDTDRKHCYDTLCELVPQLASLRDKTGPVSMEDINVLWSVPQKIYAVKSHFQLNEGGTKRLEDALEEARRHCSYNDSFDLLKHWRDAVIGDQLLAYVNKLPHELPDEMISYYNGMDREGMDRGLCANSRTYNVIISYYAHCMDVAGALAVDIRQAQGPLMKQWNEDWEHHGIFPVINVVDVLAKAGCFSVSPGEASEIYARATLESFDAARARNPLAARIMEERSQGSSGKGQILQ